ncbi:FKBP-type peptidyl-prolyl cis-trans isomerase [Algibacter pacificus]|uniref:FKBP-type peptidyl-prolyl cis-trans isomerase n=1 Tax=Algibacter pacificus TaxID=2599389 RepID=UPI0011C9B4C3|nr:FKBP-type peptidyl-prolyl cis-trans isomerase [Algibacter pacificus]
MKNTLLIALTLLVITSCSKTEEFIDYSEENDAEIQTYLSDNNLDAEKSNSGLYYIIDEQGTGEAPILYDRVLVDYKGYLTDGTVFDESTDDYFDTYLEGLMYGWLEGIPYFNEGGSGKLIVPAHLGYGSSTNGIIPAGSVLIFDIELIYVNYKTENDQDILEYIEDNNLTAEKTGSGLYYIIDEEGTGAQPTESDNVTVAYKGYYTDGTVFDESDDSGVSFNLQQVIAGWTEGIPYFKEGGSGKLLVPAHLAYGNYYYNGIQAGSVLIFDVNLISVN